MSYTPYTPPTQQGTTTTTTSGQTIATPQPATAAYPYGAYSAYAATPGAYTYAAGAYQAGVTGYGWTYPYGYVPQHPQQTTTTSTAITPVAPQVPRPTVTTTPITTQTSTPAPLPQRTATFSAYTPTYSRDTTAASGRGGRRQSNLKGLFTKELRSLMYGFGDDRNPANDTVSVMEEILIEYITDICQTAAGPQRKNRLSIDDLRRALSRPADAKKLARMEELLFMQEDIKRARAQFEESDIQQTKGL